MFSKITNKLRHSLALRLSVWYAGIFAVFSIIAFILAYFSVAAVLQVQTDEDLEEDISEFAAFMRLGGVERVKKEILLETQGKEAQQIFFRLWAIDGSLLATSDLSSWAGLTESTNNLAQVRSTNKTLLVTLKLGQHDYDVRSITAFIGPDTILQIGESLEDNKDLMAVLLQSFLVLLTAVVLFGGPIGWFMAKRALRGVQEITNAASASRMGHLNNVYRCAHKETNWID